MKNIFLSAVVTLALMPLGCAKNPGTSPTAPAPAKVGARAPAKATFTSDKYGFALYLPSQPQTKQQEIPREMGGGTMDLFIVPPAPVAYTIVPLKLPGGAADADESKFFDGVEEGLLQSTKGKRLSSRDIEVNGQSLREVKTTFSTPTPTSQTPVKFVNQTRIYRIGDRSIQFAAIAPETELAKNQAQIDKVLNSIVVTK